MASKKPGLITVVLGIATPICESKIQDEGVKTVTSVRNAPFVACDYAKGSGALLW